MLRSAAAVESFNEIPDFVRLNGPERSNRLTDRR